MCGDEGSVGVKMWWLVQTSTVPNYKYMPLLSHCDTVVSVLGCL